MSRTTLRGWLTLAVVGSVLAVGCGQKAAGPTTYPVTGTVTHNGTPVEGATVAFMASGEQKGAVGRTDASGKYTLTTLVAGDGAMAGEYAVKISKYEGAAERPPA
jgi:hypothetical protein